MRHTLLVAVALMGLAACARETDAPQEKAQAVAARAERDPAQIVRPLYDRYLREGEPMPALHEAAPWTDDLRGEIESTLAYSSTVGEPIIDFDPLIDAQDFQLSDLRVERVQRLAPDRAIVEARFANMGRTTIVYYDMRVEGGAWRIDNVRTPAWNLRDITAATPAPAVQKTPTDTAAAPKPA